MTGLVVSIKSGHLLLLLLRSRWHPICLCFPLTHTFHRSRPIRLYFPMTFYRSYAVRFCLPVHTVLDCLWLWLLLLLLLQWIILWLLACILLISAKFAWVPVTIEWVLRNAAHPRIPRHFVSRHVGHTCYWDIKRNRGKEREREELYIMKSSSANNIASFNNDRQFKSNRFHTHTYSSHSVHSKALAMGLWLLGLHMLLLAQSWHFAMTLDLLVVFDCFENRISELVLHMSGHNLDQLYLDNHSVHIQLAGRRHSPKNKNTYTIRKTKSISIICMMRKLTLKIY